MKKVLIFGGSGQIGRHLIRRLTNNNHQVTVATRNSHSKGSILKTQGNPGYIEIVDHLLEIPSVRNAQDGERIYQGRRNAGANIPLDRAHRSAEYLAGHAQDIAEPHRQTGEDGSDREHNIRQDSSL